MSIEIVGKTLTMSQVAPDGRTIRLGFEDIEGRQVGVTFPRTCIIQLLMTLPHLISMAIKSEFNDDSMRLVFPLADWQIETATTGQGLILTLKTPDGFEVSFSLEAQTLAQMLWCAEAGEPSTAPSQKSLN